MLTLPTLRAAILIQLRVNEIRPPSERSPQLICRGHRLAACGASGRSVPPQSRRDAPGPSSRGLRSKPTIRVPLVGPLAGSHHSPLPEGPASTSRALRSKSTIRSGSAYPVKRSRGSRPVCPRSPARLIPLGPGACVAIRVRLLFIPRYAGPHSGCLLRFEPPAVLAIRGRRRFIPRYAGPHSGRLLRAASPACCGKPGRGFCFPRLPWRASPAGSRVARSPVRPGVPNCARPPRSLVRHGVLPGRALRAPAHSRSAQREETRTGCAGCLVHSSSALALYPRTAFGQGSQARP